MDIVEDLPGMLRKLTLSYMNLAEMIEIGIPLTRHNLIEIVEEVFPGRFTNWTDAKTVARTIVEELQKRFRYRQFPHWIGDGLTALFLLDQLPLTLKLHGYDKWLEYVLTAYWKKQSLVFRKVMYLHLFETLNPADYPAILSGVLMDESHNLEANSLEYLYDLFGPQVFLYIQPNPLYRNSEPSKAFFLAHFDEVPITPNLIKLAVETDNKEFIIKVGQRLAASGGSELSYRDVRSLVRQIEHYDLELYQYLRNLWGDESSGEESEESDEYD